MSSYSTSFPSDSATRLWRIRDPSAWRSSRKLTCFRATALYSFTGTFRSPKLIVPDQIQRLDQASPSPCLRRLQEGDGEPARRRGDRRGNKAIARRGGDVLHERAGSTVEDVNGAGVDGHQPASAMAPQQLGPARVGR